MKEAFIQSPITFDQLIILQKYQSNAKLKETSQKYLTKSFSLEIYTWVGFFSVGLG